MSFLPQEILVCMALPEEGGKVLEELGAKVLYTGLGKVNAAYHLTKALAKQKPKLVVNFGTAGSKLFNRREVVACNRFIQRDMDVSPLGFKKFDTPFEEVPMIISHRVFFNDLPNATCGSGDSFETNHSREMGEVVDMEAFALAKVCYFEDVNFACAKWISDGADGNASADWQQSLIEATHVFTEMYQQLLKK